MLHDEEMVCLMVEYVIRMLKLCPRKNTYESQHREMKLAEG